MELERVSVVRKLLYAVGTLPYALTLNIIGFYFTVFLLDVALVSQDFCLVISFIIISVSLARAPVLTLTAHGTLVSRSLYCCTVAIVLIRCFSLEPNCMLAHNLWLLTCNTEYFNNH